MSIENINHISDLENEIDTSLLDKVLKDIGNEIVEKIKDNTPVDTGALRNSIKFKQEDHTISFGSDLEYAMKVEFEDKSYLRKTLNENKTEISNRIGEVLKGVFEEWS